MSLRLKIIVGSTRPDRAADLVVPWVAARARAREEFEVEVLDLREWPLPVFQEHAGTIGDIADPTYSSPAVKDWTRKVKEGDAYVIITPEYNHSIPSVLKNAIENTWLSSALRNKPMLAVAYSGGIVAGARAVEHLAGVAIDTEMVPLRNAVLIPMVGAAFDEDDNPKNPASDEALTIGLDDLTWWAKALAAARTVGELPPAPFRRK